jgi:translin
VNELSDSLSRIAEAVRVKLAVKDAAREKALPLCRQSIRYCSQAIRAIHRDEFDQAGLQLGQARGLLGEAAKEIGRRGELRNTGFLRDAEKEFAEGSILLAVVTRSELPDLDKLGIEADAYLNGLGEAAGELRRYLLDSLRKGDSSRGEELLSAMDDIYNILVDIDFPDAITGGLRRTTDMVRGVLERTRSDLTLMITQKSLEARLGRYEQNIE